MEKSSAMFDIVRSDKDKYRKEYSLAAVFMRVWLLTVFILSLTVFFSHSTYAASVPKAPRGVLANGVGGTIVLSWEAVKDADGYIVYESSSDKDTGFEEIINTRKTSLLFSGRTPGTKYRYKIKAFRKNGKGISCSSYSRQALTTVPDKGSRTTLKNFMTTAMAPVGTTMYIYGGGWHSKWKNKGADGAWIGLNPTWRSYADGRKASFNYRRVRYKKGYGLDCSGYVGWVTYNVMKTSTALSGRGFVMKSTSMTAKYARRGWGTYKKASKVKNFRAGDIMSTSGHVYIVVGECKDGSVVLLHASPPGIQICGTATRAGKKNSQAVKIAGKYRKKYFPAWQKRFPVYDRPASFITRYNQFRWTLSPGNVMSDPDGYRNMRPDKILDDLLKVK